MLAALLLTTALAADPEPVGTGADLGSEQRRVLRQGRQLRTTGAALAVAGPPTIVAGWMLTARGARDGRDGLALAGVGLGAAGGLATVAGVPLVLGGGAVGRHVARRNGSPARSVALPVVSGALFVGSGALLIGGGFDGPSWPTWTASGLYVGGLTLAWIDANQALRAGGPRVSLSPWVGAGGQRGVWVAGRLR